MAEVVVWLLSEPTPLRLHVTPSLLVSLVRVALMLSCCPWSMVWGAAGDNEMPIAEVATAIRTDPVALELAAEVAVIVTVVAVDTLVGAV